MSKLRHKLKRLFVFHTLALGTMYAVNRIISSSAIIKNILNPGVGKYYHWKLGTVFYRKVGSGAPLLLLHDLSCDSSSFEWNQLEYKLSKNHTVYTIDLLGCGRSDKPALTYTNYLYVQLITDFIQTVIGEKTDVAATGFSCSFLTMAAYSNTDVIDKIIMINPPSLKKLNQIPNDRSKTIRGIISIPIIGTTIYHLRFCRQNVEYMLTENDLFNPFRVQKKYVDAYYEAAHRGHGNGKYLLASLDGLYLNVNIKRALESIENNILIVYGAKLENENEIVESYKKINPNLSTISLSGAKFLPQLELPEELFAAMEEFLR